MLRVGEAVQLTNRLSAIVDQCQKGMSAMEERQVSEFDVPFARVRVALLVGVHDLGGGFWIGHEGLQK